jgi:hypothetical protein
MSDVLRSSWGFMQAFVIAASSSIDARSAIVAVVIALVCAVIVAVLCQLAGVAQGPILAAVTFLVVLVVLLLL